MAIHTSRRLAAELCDALGLKWCRSLTINVPFNDCISVTAECLLEDGQLQKVVKVLQDCRPAVETTVIGDEFRSSKPSEVAQ